MIGTILNLMGDISGKRILKYSLLPEIGPRIKSLILEGFSNLAFFMAMVYHAVKLIPHNHPYLKYSSIGQYSIRDVLVEASHNIHFDYKHIDQIIIFFSLIIGIVILAIQFFILLLAILIRPASAQVDISGGYGNFFKTEYPSDDIAFRMLDKVFGIPDLFGSKEITSSAFHTALHGLFQFYSVGLLVIGGMLFLYLIFTVVAETAQTGTPFGKRYNHVWVPIRIVVAFGLLIPISYGLNSGQWITLYAAKMGSGFATNGWYKFNETLRGETTLNADSPVAEPNLPELRDLARFMMLAKACKYAYPDKIIEPYLINSSNATDASKKMNGIYGGAVKYSNNKLIYIRFGELGTEENPYPRQTGNVYPYCGNLTLIVPEPFRETSDVTFGSAPSHKINEAYYDLIWKMWNEDYEGIDKEAENIILKYIDPRHTPTDIPTDFKEKIAAAQIEDLKPKIQDAIDQAIEEFKMDEEYLKFGWGGAGIFYNDIADINGRITNAIFNKPQINAYPHLMAHTCQENQAQNENVPPEDCYSANLAKSEPVNYESDRDANIETAYDEIYQYWHEEKTGNALINVINVMFGTQGLFDMCRNADSHPLAQLSTLGKGLVEAAIRNIGIGLGLGLASIIPVIGPTAGAISSMALTFASIGILIGFMLYYIMPFLPFLYFLFAVGGWVKGLFEAMVGVPLWALAHIRIDGQGLPGDGGINGYFLIFEIFIRPILIVFGLIAAVIIFGAMIKILNDIFGIAVNNLSGNDPSLGEACFSGDGGEPIPGDVKEGMIETFRGPIDEFFYTIVYAILVYMIGMSTFKLIDLIPNNILRWMGQGVPTFNDNAGEPAEGLMTKIAVGGGLAGREIQQAGSHFANAAKGFGKGAVSLVTPSKPT